MIVFHVPVLKDRVVEYLRPVKGKVIIDATLGGGGHVKEILKKEKEVVIIGIDWDEYAIEYAKRILGNGNIKYFCKNFVYIKEIVKEAGLDKVWGILFDFGVSYFQVKNPLRGFSYDEEGPLDMRMSRDLKKNALSIIKEKNEKEIARIIKIYGEDPHAKKIAKIIGFYKDSIHTTKDLVECVRKAVPKKYLRKSLRRVFQALRIVVNNELENIEKGVREAFEVLEKGGRICTITYHSIEDRIIKRIFKEFEKKGIGKIITKKPVVPEDSEIEENPRARSAKLRVLERI